MTVRAEELAVSVIVPVYNTEPYLRECLDSVLTQRLADIEVLCVDDGSTDASPDILAEYARRDPRLRVVRQRPGGKGPGTARNTAIREARGAYIAFVDSDDKIHKDMLQQLHRAAEQHEADIAMCMIERFSARGDKGRYGPCSYDHYLPAGLERRTFSWRDIQDELFNVRFVAWNKLYHRNFLGKWNLWFSEGIFFEDLAFTFPAMLCATRMRLVRRPLYYNRKERRGATTFEQGARAFDALAAMEHFEQFLRTDPAYEPLWHRFEAFRFNKLYEYLHKNDTAHLEPYFARLKQFAASPSLAGNPYLRKAAAQRLPLIQEQQLLDFLAYELWDARVRNASLARQRRRLRQVLMPAIKAKRLTIRTSRRVRALLSR